MRVCAYIRVSSETQVEQYSLDAQRTVIEQFARAHGWAVAEYFVDAGQSAFTDDPAARPAFARLMAEVDSRHWDMVLVAKLDRFARSIIVAVSQLKRMQAAGVALTDVGNSLDYSTQAGKFMFGIQSLIAENESEANSERSRAGIAEKRRQGGHHGGIPFGARRGADGRLGLDPATAPVLARVLTLAATRSFGEVARELNADGVPSPRGATWQPAAIHKMIGGGRWLQAQDAPWPSLWAAALARPRVPAVNWSRNPSMLTGLLRCACGGTIVYAGTKRTPRGVTYRGIECRHYTRERPNGHGCPIRKRGPDHYEALVTRWLLRLPDLTAVRAVAGRDVAGVLAALAERRLDAGALLDGRSISRDDYRRRIAALDAEEAVLRLPLPDYEALARELLVTQALFPGEPPVVQNLLLRRLIRRVVVEGSAVTIEPVADLRDRLDAAGWAVYRLAA